MILEAADRVTLATPSYAALLTAPNSRSVTLLPPKTNTRTTNSKTIVKGTAKIGEANHIRISSIAATPRAMYAQVGIEAEYVSF